MSVENTSELVAPPAPEPVPSAPSPVPGLIARGAIVAASIVVAALITSAVVLILIVIAGAIVGAGSSTPSTGAATAGSGALVQSVLQAGVALIGATWIALAGSAFFSGVTLNVGSSIGVGSGVGIFGVPLLITAVVVVVGLVAGRLVARRGPALSLGLRFAQAAIAGGIAAIAMELIAAIGSIPASISIVSLSVSALGLPLFLGAFLITALTAFAGGAIAVAAPGVSLPRALRVGYTRIPALWRQLIVVAATGAVVWVLYTIVGGIFDEATASGGIDVRLLIGAIPLWVPTIAIWAAALGQGGGLLATGTAGALGTSQSGTGVLTAFSQGSSLALVVGQIVVAIVSAIVLSIAVPIDRRPRFGVLALQLAGVWLVLPYVFGVLAASGVGSVIGANAGGTIVVAPWTFLLAGVWGLGIDALARWVMPAWRRGAAGPAVRIRLLSIVAVVMLVAVIGGIGITSAVLTSTYSAQATAQRYLDALANRDAKAATALETGDGGGSTRVMPSAGNALKGAKVVVTAATSTETVVTASFNVGGKALTRSLTLVPDGTGPFGVTKWAVSTPMVDSVTIATGTLSGPITVGAQRFTPRQGAVQVSMYPGVYPISATGGSQNLLTFPTVLSGDGAPASFGPSRMPKLTDTVGAAVRSDLDTCAKSTDAQPAGCPFGAYLYGTVKDISWKITTYPTVAVSTDGSSFSTTECGAATASYEYQYFSGDPFATDTAEDSCFDVSGTVAVSDGAVRLTYDSSY